MAASITGVAGYPSKLVIYQLRASRFWWVRYYAEKHIFKRTTKTENKRDALEAAKARGIDVLIADTAGRLHNKSNLMEELAKIRRVLQKHDPAAPQHRWLVVDGSLGSNSIEQAKVFHQSFGLTGLVVTKLDGTSRGGAIVGIYRQLRIPILFLGLGEQPEDLQPFSAENYAKAVFGLE